MKRSASSRIEPGKSSWSWLWLFPYFLALAAPNLLLHNQDTDDVTLVLAILAFTILAAIHLGFTRFHWVIVLMLPAFILLPFDLYYTWHYHEVLTPRVIAIALQSPVEQIESYLLPRLPTLLALLGLSLIVWTLALRYSKGSHIVSTRRRLLQRLCRLGLLMCIAAGSLTVYKTYTQVRPPFDAQALALVGQLVQGTFPLGRLMSIARYFVESEKHAEIVAQRRAKPITILNSNEPTSPYKSIVVLVIGESSNRDHWSLFGYGRSTTPNLSAQKGLIPLTNLISPWPSTLMAVPLMLTAKSALDTNFYSNEPSVIAVLRKAGYATYWISTQGSTGSFDRSISDLAEDAEFRNFVAGPTALRPGQPGDDAQLLPLINAALKSDSKKLFLVVHTQGSHFPYWERYPAEFARFQPTQKSFHFKDWKNDERHREALTNSYDNSVLYTDHVLSQIIKTLESSERHAMMMYASDHGESLPTAQCDRFGHGFKSPSNFIVPGFIWLNLAVRSSRPALYEQTSRNAKMRLTTASIFPTLLDLAEVRLEGANESLNLASKFFKEHPRFVNAPKPIDFDLALKPPVGCK